MNHDNAGYLVLSLLSIGQLKNRQTIVGVKHIHIETIQPPEMNETLFRLGVEFTGAEMVALLLEAEFARAEFVRGRVWLDPP